MSRRQLTMEQHLVRARSNMMLSQPFFGQLAMYLEYEFEPSIGTLDTNGRRIRINPSFFLDLTEKLRISAICHEVMHCAFRHRIRCGGRNPRIWNIACDAVINNMLVQSGLPLGAGWIDMPQYGEMSAEEIYAALLNEFSNGGLPTFAFDGDMFGPGESNEPAQDSPEFIQDEADWEQRVAAAASNAAGQGKLSQGLARLTSLTNRTPVMDWRAVLREILPVSTSNDTTWMQPSRRSIAANFYMPAPVPNPTGTIVIAIDTSGSIRSRDLEAFHTEITSIMETCNLPRVVVMYVDSKVCGVDEFELGDNFKVNFRGGGGTWFDPAFEYTKKHYDDTVALVYFTDGEGSASLSSAPDFPVLWVLTGTRKPDAQFGLHLFMNPKT